MSSLYRGCAAVIIKTNLVHFTAETKCQNMDIYLWAPVRPSSENLYWLVKHTFQTVVYILTLYYSCIIRRMAMAMPHGTLCNRHAWYCGCTVTCGIKAFLLTNSDRLFWPLASNIRCTSVSEGNCSEACPPETGNRATQPWRTSSTFCKEQLVKYGQKSKVASKRSRQHQSNQQLLLTILFVL